MSFVLDNSLTMRGFFGDGTPKELAYAGKVLDAMVKATALVAVTWGLEVANVFARAQARSLVTEARSGAFLEMRGGGAGVTVDSATHAMHFPTRCSSPGVTGCPPRMLRTWNWP